VGWGAAVASQQAWQVAPARREVRAERGTAGEAGAGRGGVGARQQMEQGAVARTRGRGGEVRRRREAAGRTGCTCPRVPIANRGGTLVGKKRNFLGLFVNYNLVEPDRWGPQQAT
jgi:hypothetical protein